MAKGKAAKVPSFMAREQAKQAAKQAAKEEEEAHEAEQKKQAQATKVEPGPSDCVH